MKNFAAVTLIVFSFFLFSASGNALTQEPAANKDLSFAKEAYRDGLYELAQSKLESYLKDNPESYKNPEMHLFLGECLLKQNKLTRAMSEFKLVLNSKDEKLLAQATYWVGEANFSGKDYALAINFYDEVISKYTSSKFMPYALYSKGWAQLELGNYDEAIINISAAEERYPNAEFALEAKCKLADALYKAKRYEEAKVRLEQAISACREAGRQTSDLFLLSAAVASETGDAGKAIDDLEKALAESAPKASRPYIKSRLGWLLFKSERYEEAKKTFQEFEESHYRDPLMPYVMLGLGQSLLAFGEREKGINKLTELTNKYPQSEFADDALYAAAGEYYKSGDYEKAAVLYKKLTSLFPKGNYAEEARYNAGWCSLKLGKKDDAVKEFIAIADKKSDADLNASALCRIGDIYLDEKDFDSAIYYYDKVLKDHPEGYLSDYAQYQFAVTLFRKNKFEESALAFQSVISNFPKSRLIEKSVYHLGLIYFRLGEFENSASQFKAFVDSYPQSEQKKDALFQLGSSYYNAGKHKDAQDIFRLIIKDYPQTQIERLAKYELALSYYQSGMEKEALAELNDYLAKYPKADLVPDIEFWFGEYYYNKGDFKNAQGYFKKIMSEYPSSSTADDAQYWLAFSLYSEGDIDGAASEFTRMIERFPKSELSQDATIKLGEMLAAIGKESEAIRRLEEVIDKHPNTPFEKLSLEKIGEILKKQNKPEEAIPYLKKALTDEGSELNARIQFHLAECYEDLSNYDTAVTEYLKVPYLFNNKSGWGAKAQLRSARIFEKENKIEDAKRLYEKLAKEDVDEAKYAKERLEYFNGR